MKFSVVTITAGRDRQLINQAASIERSTVLPYEHVVVSMDGRNVPALYESSAVRYRIERMRGSNELPLAAARNQALNLAACDRVIVLDVDCIVSPTLFQTMLDALEHAKGNLVSAKPRYLPIVPDHGTYSSLSAQAVTHPNREPIPTGIPVDYRLFWSLVFGGYKTTLLRCGGFDETFVGYGAEDTDYIHQLHQSGVGLIFVEDYVLHQYHTKIDPPLNHLKDIVSNAQRYQEKWGIRPMEGWLIAFEKLGLIHLQDNRIDLIRMPTAAEIQEHLSTQPY